MTDVSISNTVVQEKLQNSSVTVPSGEVWQVHATTSDSEAEMSIDGTPVLKLSQSSSDTGVGDAGPIILVGGQSIGENGRGGTLYLSGIKVE